MANAETAGTPRAARTDAVDGREAEQQHEGRVHADQRPEDADVHQRPVDGVRRYGVRHRQQVRHLPEHAHRDDQRT